jgi:hypothetical protein
MVERVCPVCQTGNPIEAEQCVECRALLDQPLVHQPQRSLTRRMPALPARWERAGKAVALGAVALAVEVGAAWLQHRNNAKAAPLARQTNTVEPVTSPRRFVARQRVWETFEQDGRLSRRVVEQTLWRLDE